MNKMIIFVLRNELQGNSISKSDLRNLDGVNLNHHDFGAIQTFCNIVAYNEVRILKLVSLPMFMMLRDPIDAIKKTRSNCSQVAFIL